MKTLYCSIAALFVVGAGSALAQEPGSQPASSPTSASASMPALAPPPLLVGSGSSEAAFSSRPRSGTFQLVSSGALFGVLSGVTLSTSVGVNSIQAGAGITLLTGSAGGLMGYGYHRLHREYTEPQASAVSVGGTLGFFEGILLPLALDNSGERRVTLPRMWLGMAGGLGLGVLGAELGNPKSGDAVLVGSSAAWATLTTLELFALLQGNIEELDEVLALGYNIGIAGGTALAFATDVSERRLKIGNGAGALGALGGGLAGVIAAATVQGDSSTTVRILLGSTLLGQVGGITIGILASDDDKAPREKRASFQGLVPSLSVSERANEQPLLLQGVWSF